MKRIRRQFSQEEMDINVELYKREKYENLSIPIRTIRKAMGEKINGSARLNTIAPCHRYFQTHKKEINAKTRKRYVEDEAFRNRNLEWQKKWRKENPDKVKEKNRKYNKKNKKIISEKAKIKYQERKNGISK